MAAAIAEPRFVPLDGATRVLLLHEPARASFHAELARFLGEDGPAVPRALRAAGLTPAEAGVMRLVAEGLDNRAIALSLGKRERTVRNQMSVILDKLGVRSRAQAIVLALAG